MNNIPRALTCLLAVIASADAICVGRRKNSTCVSIRERFREILFFRTVCHGRLGCFYTGPPWYHPVHRPISLPPESPDALSPKFLLYTRRNRYRPIFLVEGNATALRTSPFDPRALTRVIIHGYMDAIGISTWGLNLKDAILDVSDDNVIYFDWSGGNRVFYAVATANTRTAGALLANFILFLMKETWIKPEQLHFLGHSLGAHISSYVGQRIKNVGRISGFDPAGPNFNYMPPEVVLDPNDALFVDNVHTDQGEMIVDGLGISQDDGHLDFWPWNGEVPLPICTDRVEELIARHMPIELTFYLTGCRHYTSIELYIYSFNQSGCLFVGVRCASWEAFLSGLCDCGPEGERCEIMGFFARPPADHSWERDSRYYLKTALKRPYCVHQYVLTVYVYNPHPVEKDLYADFRAEVTLDGRERVFQTEIQLRLSSRIRLQKLGYLLTNEKPLGDVHFGAIRFCANASECSGTFHNSGYSVNEIEVTYLYPAPKEETSFHLCREWECQEGFCENFSFREEFCDRQKYEKDTV